MEPDAAQVSRSFVLALLAVRTVNLSDVAAGLANGAEDALADYALRWNIETLFGALKSRGFRLEDTRLYHQARLEKLFGMPALPFTWAHLVGQWVDAVQPSRRITRRAHRLVKSVFRAGLDFLRGLVVNSANPTSLNNIKSAFRFCPVHRITTKNSTKY